MPQYAINDTQSQAKAQLEERVGRSVALVDSNDECACVIVDGVTVTMGHQGGFGIPSVRTYDSGLETAASARSLWEKQSRRDSRDLEGAGGRITGHHNPVVNAQWRCSGMRNVPAVPKTI